MSAVDLTLYRKICERGWIAGETKPTKAAHIALYALGEGAAHLMLPDSIQTRVDQKLGLFRELQSGESRGCLKAWLEAHPQMPRATRLERVERKRLRAAALEPLPSNELDQQVRDLGLRTLFTYFDEDRAILSSEAKIAVQRLLWIHAPSFLQMIVNWAEGNRFRGNALDGLKDRYEKICPEFQYPLPDSELRNTISCSLHEYIGRAFLDMFDIPFSDEARRELLRQMAETPSLFFNLARSRPFQLFQSLRSFSTSLTFLFDMLLFRSSEPKFCSCPPKQLTTALQQTEAWGPRFFSGREEYFALFCFLVNNPRSIEEEAPLEAITIGEYIHFAPQPANPRSSYPFNFTKSQIYFLERMDIEAALTFLEVFFRKLALPVDPDFAFHFLMNPPDFSSIDLSGYHEDLRPAFLQELHSATKHLPVRLRFDVGFPRESINPGFRKRAVVIETEEVLAEGLKELFAMRGHSEALERVLFIHEAFIGETYAQALVEWGGEGVDALLDAFPKRQKPERKSSTPTEGSFRDYLIKRTLDAITLDLEHDLSEGAQAALIQLMHDEQVRRELIYSAQAKGSYSPLYKKLAPLIDSRQPTHSFTPTRRDQALLADFMKALSPLDSGQS